MLLQMTIFHSLLWPSNIPLSVYTPHFFFFILFSTIVSLFWAALGLQCCPRPFSSCNKRELLSVAVLKLLLAVASPVAAVSSVVVGAQA